LPRTLLIFPAVVSLYVEISQRRKPLHNAVAIQPRSDADVLSSIDHPADESSSSSSGTIRTSSGTVRLIFPSKFEKWLRSPSPAHEARSQTRASNFAPIGTIKILRKEERQRQRDREKKKIIPSPQTNDTQRVIRIRSSETRKRFLCSFLATSPSARSTLPQA